MLLGICILSLVIARPCHAHSMPWPPGWVVTFPAPILADDITQRIDCHPSPADVDNNPRSPFLPNSTEPTVLDADFLSLRRLQDEPLCPQSSETIDTIQLRKYKSWWPDWLHEFIVISFACQGENYFMRLDRSWEGTGWRESIPLPTVGSTKPAANSVTIHYRKDPHADNTTKVIAQLDFHCGLSFKDISEPLSHVLLHAGSYSLVGMNCWSWSRYLYSSIAESTRDFILAVHQTRDIDLSQGQYGKPDPWLEFGNYRFLNSTKPSIGARIPGVVDHKTFQESRLSLTVQTHYDDYFLGRVVYSQYPGDQKPTFMLDESQNPPPVILDFLSQGLPRSTKLHRSILRLDYVKETSNHHTCDTFVVAAITRPHSKTQVEYLATSFHKIPNYARKTTMILFSGHPFLESPGARDEIAVWVGCWLENQRPPFAIDGRTWIRHSGPFVTSRSHITGPVPVHFVEDYSNESSPSWTHQVPALPAKAGAEMRFRLPEGIIFLDGKRYSCQSCPEDWI